MSMPARVSSCFTAAATAVRDFSSWLLVAIRSVFESRLT
jgi:hypothetical protein